MIIGNVVGNLWATRKEESLNGLKFLIVETIEKKTIVACDFVGAGIGDKVLITLGSSARKASENMNISIDAGIIGIIDGIEGE